MARGPLPHLCVLQAPGAPHCAPIHKEPRCRRAQAWAGTGQQHRLEVVTCGCEGDPSGSLTVELGPDVIKNVRDGCVGGQTLRSTEDSGF